MGNEVRRQKIVEKKACNEWLVVLDKLGEWNT